MKRDSRNEEEGKCEAYSKAMINTPTMVYGLMLLTNS